MRRPARFSSRFVRPLQLLRLEERAVPATIVWQGGGSNNWSDATQWVGGKLPGLADVAQFNPGAPGVNIDTAQSVAGVEFNNGWNATATLTANLTTTAGPSLWNSGSVNGPGTWNVGGSVTLNGATPTLNGATMNITGTVNHVTANNLNNATAQIIIGVGGAYDFQSDAGWANVGGSQIVVNVQGTLRKSAGLGGSSANGVVNIQGGTVSSTSGTLYLVSAGGTHTGATFNAGTGAAVDVTGGQGATWKGTFTGTGAGAVFMQGGAINIDPAGATFNFPGTSPFQFNGGSIIGSTLNNTATIWFNGGTPNLNGTVLNNTGTIYHKTANTLNAGNSAVINNESTGIYDFQSDTAIVNAFGAPQTFNNKGLVRKTAGGGGTAIYGIVNNFATGIWDAQTGILSMAPSNGGTHAGGTFKASSGAFMDLCGGQSATWEGTYTGSGAGTVVIPNGNVNIGAAGATFNFPGTTPLYWNGGSINGGNLLNTGTINLNGGTPSLNATMLTNTGTIIHTTANNLNAGNSATINNEATGTYDFKADSSIAYAFGAQQVFNNKGLVRKSSGTGGSGVNGIVNNFPTGVWESQVGTLYMSSNNGTHTGGTFKAASGAAVNLNGGLSATWTGSYTGSGAGYVGINSGVIYVGTAGMTLNFSAGTPFHWSGGMLQGTTGGSTLTNSGVVLIDGGTVTANADLTIINNGTFTHSAANNINAGSGFVFKNEPTGVYDFQTDFGFVWAFGSSPVFDNKGLVKKTGGAGGSYLNGTVNMLGGTLDAQTGVLGMSTGTGVHTGGTFNASLGAIIDLNGGQTATWKGTFTGSGAGTVGIYNGQVNVDPAGATFNFPTTGLLQWNGGNIIGGTFTNSGSMTMAGGTATLAGSVIQNNGTFRHNTVNNMNVGNGSVFNNAGTFEFLSDGNMVWAFGSPAVFNNSGLVVKKGGTGNSYLQLIINASAGAIFETQTKGLVLDHNGGAGTFVDGKFTVAAGTNIYVTSNNSVNWKGTFTATGTGNVVLNSGSIIADPAGVTFNFPTGTFQWAGGSLGSGTYTNQGTVDITGATVNLDSAATVFNNNGMVRHYSVNNLNINSSATFNNKLTGSYEFYTDASIVWAAGAPGVFNNAGLIVKKGGASSSYVYGNVNMIGGTLESQSGNVGISTNGGGTHTGGTFKASTGCSVDMTGNQPATWEGKYTIAGAGAVTIPYGTVNVGPAGVDFTSPTAGVFQWNGGNIQGGTVTLNGFLDLNGGGVGLFGNTTVLNINGTVRHLTANNLQTVNSPVINIAVGGLYDMKADSGIVWVSGTNHILNIAGILRKSGGTGGSQVNGTVTNTGSVEALSGTINMVDSITNYSAGNLVGGKWLIGAGLNFNSTPGITTNKATVTYTGTGGNFTNFTGVTTNEGTLAVINTGSFSPSNTLTNKATVNIEAGSTLGGAIDYVENGGTTTVNGTLDPVGNVNITGGTVTGTGTVKSNTFNSAGTLLATLTGLTVDGVYTLSGTGLTSVPVSTQLKNTGIAALNGGTSTVAGTWTITGVPTQTGGTTDILTNGVVAATAGFALAGGVLKGNGTLTGNLTNSAGSIEPGSSPGQISVVGDFVQSGTGKLLLELNGTTAITQYDRLNVTGKVTLGGTVETTLGFPTVSGDNFVVITNDSTDKTTGTFNGVAENSNIVLGGATFRVNYNAGDGNDVVLTRLATGITSLVIADGSAQRSMVKDITIAFGGLVNFPTNKSDAIILTRTGPGAPTGAVTVSVDTATLSTTTQTIAKLTFSGSMTQFNSLIDGNYQLQVLGALLTDQGGQLVDADNNGTAGGTNSSVLHRLYGDSNGDKTVNSADFLAFRLAFLSPSLAFDLDGSGTVDTNDFLAFRLNFLKTLP